MVAFIIFGFPKSPALNGRRPSLQEKKEEMPRRVRCLCWLSINGQTRCTTLNPPRSKCPLETEKQLVGRSFVAHVITNSNRTFFATLLYFRRVTNFYYPQAKLFLK
ncbi:hypothetical protein ISCGN_023217 [Ixodes scapularis]